MNQSGRSSARARPVTTRNAQFQEWSALLTNRGKRRRSGAFLIQGVRPITMADRAGWPLRALLYPRGSQPSAWARELIGTSRAARFELDPQLLRELGQQESETPEVIAVGELAADDVARLPVGPDMLVVVFDRPTSPGNIGTLIRAADALGGSGLITTGHAADIYDPKCVRASTGSLFAVPAVRLESTEATVQWITACRDGGVPVRVVGLDESGSVPLAEATLTGPTVLVVGNEKTGMSASWREVCDEMVQIPIGGTASSLNAASAGTVALYEAARQRGFPSG